MQLEHVFTAQRIMPQTNKFAALTSLLTEEEAYVVCDLTVVGSDRPSNIFDAAQNMFLNDTNLPFIKDSRVHLPWAA